MIVRCNHPGGINLLKLRLKFGENDVDRGYFEEVLKKVSPKFLQGARSLMPDSNLPYLDWDGAPPVLERATTEAEDEQGTKPTPATDVGKSPSPSQMNAKQKIAAIAKCATVEELKALMRGSETRASVIEAADRKFSEFQSK